MASIIKIKRSITAGAPSSLLAGEMAYSFADPGAVQGGARLYIGDGQTLSIIGGKYFTDQLDHAPGTLTASSAIIVDADKKINELNVDNITLNNNTISTTDTDGNLVLSPNGTGKVSIASAYTLPRTDGSIGQALVTNGAGSVTFQDVSTSLTVAADTGTNDTVDLLADVLTFAGGTGIATAVTDNTITISGTDATGVDKGIASFAASYFTVTSGDVAINDASDIDKGIASFDATDFTVTTGNVALNAERIEDIAGDMVSGTGATQTNITVSYDDTNGKFTFAVPEATDSVLGVASFTSGDFSVSSGAVSLGGAVVKSVTVDNNGFATPTGGAFSILGGEGIDVTASGSEVTIKGEDASSSNKGIASFAASYFTVTNGDVAINDASTSAKGIASFNTDNFTVTSGAVTAKSATLGSSTITLGSTTNTLAGLTQLDVDNIRIDGNEISSTDTDGNISLHPNGDGTVDLNSARITSLADPVDPQDAATKAYVDAARSGLDVKQSARVATTGNITLSNTQTIDGVALVVGDRVLVKDQTDPIENGLYVVASGAWTRSADADEPNEVNAGMFVFVEEGTTNADSGFVLTTDNPLTVGTDALEFVQFSGAGQIVAGDGLSKTGNTLFVNVANGIEISADNVQLASSVAGDGLTYNSGVIAVGGTANRISVSADAIDISATYVGQSSITTLGTVSTGTWNGTAIGPVYGGTGKTSYNAFDLLVGNISTGLATLALGAAGKFLQVNSAGSELIYADIDGGEYS